MSTRDKDYSELVADIQDKVASKQHPTTPQTKPLIQNKGFQVLLSITVLNVGFNIYLFSSEQNLYTVSEVREATSQFLDETSLPSDLLDSKTLSQAVTKSQSTIVDASDDKQSAIVKPN